MKTIYIDPMDPKNLEWNDHPELNMVHCPDCKYCVKTSDGKYNPNDIVCSYWNSDGLESKDFCSYGEKGEYEWCNLECHQGYGAWMSAGPLVDTMECSECGYQVSIKDLCTPFCPWCGSKMMNFKELQSMSFGDEEEN